MHRPTPVREASNAARKWCVLACYCRPVIERSSFDELSARIEQALRNSPAQDIGKNLRALLASWFDRMDLVLREDFEVQKKLLERAQARLAQLEARLAELESRSGSRRAP